MKQRCFIDTIILYIELPVPVTLINSHSKWKHHKRKNANDSHFFNRYKNVTFRYYPCRYGKVQLWATFSIPKLLRGSNLRNITLDSTELYSAVDDILKDIIQSGPLYSIEFWQVSRADFFILHRIEPRLRTEYLNAYAKLSLGAYVPYTYGNTHYLNSTLKKHKSAGSVIRIYPKLEEIGATADDIPKDVEKDFEYYMNLCDDLVDVIRVEFQFRRRILRYFFNGAKSVALADVLDEQFQIGRINRMIERLGLHRDIISRKHMLTEIDNLFSKQPTRQRARQYISAVNNRGTSRQTIQNNFTQGQVSYIRSILHKHNLHTVTSDFEDLESVSFIE